MKVKVYHHIWQTFGRNVEQTMVFYSKEFGWREYFADDDVDECLHHKNKTEMIKSTYVQPHYFEKYGKLQYLGEL
jgi:hypothetical protein